jgi:hypothetical protein
LLPEVLFKKSDVAASFEVLFKKSDVAASSVGALGVLVER